MSSSGSCVSVWKPRLFLTYGGVVYGQGQGYSPRQGSGQGLGYGQGYTCEYLSLLQALVPSTTVRSAGSQRTSSRLSRINSNAISFSPCAARPRCEGGAKLLLEGRGEKNVGRKFSRVYSVHIPLRAGTVK
jgi:hypothetical protein